MNNPSNTSQKAKIGMKAVAWGIATNLGLAVMKYLAGYFGNSFALMADAVESASDVMASLVVLVGLRTATKAPDNEHPYGHGKAEPLAAIVVALSLVGAGAFVIIQSVVEILHPHEAPAPFTLIVLVFVIVVKQFLFSKVIKAGNEIESTAVKADAWHHLSDALTSGAAFIGISIAIIGGAGYEAADDYAAILAGLIILFNAWTNLMPAVHEIMDAAPNAKLIGEIETYVMQVPHVHSAHKTRVRKMGLDYYVDIHVWVPGDLSVREGHTVAHNVKDTLQAHIPYITDVLVHIEPTDSED
jgi:cation diffusion facilitator family transporter